MQIPTTSQNHSGNNKYIWKNKGLNVNRFDIWTFQENDFGLFKKVG